LLASFSAGGGINNERNGDFSTTGFFNDQAWATRKGSTDGSQS
jgi:hypothetical protein